MATYLGNASLSSAVKERVLSTFQQSVALFKQGRMDEVVQGCGLILRMDPMFDPAKKLLEKARNPSSPVDVDALIPAEVPDTRLQEARTAMAGRDFQRVLDLTTELLTEDLTNDDARILNEQAREKTEAGPFVEQFIRKAETYIAQRHLTAARQELDKARALDDDHPAIRRVEQSMVSAPAAPPPSSASFIVDTPAAGPARGAAQAADFGFTFEEEKQQQGGSPLDFFSPTPPAAPAQPSGGFSFETPAPPVPPPPAAPANDSPFGGFSFDTPSAPNASSSPFGSFSFDTPSPAAPAPPPVAEQAHTFDFSTADIVTSPDDQKKIAQYLSDGDRAFDSGDYQQAIDLWSRIFLIDVTNDDASQRIEKAKAKRREVESKVEAALAAGIQAVERKDKETARARLNEVLHLDPHNATATEYLAQIDDSGAAAGAYSSPFMEPPSPAPKSDLFDDDLGGTYDSSLIPPDTPPAPPAAKGGKAPAAPAPAKGKAAPASAATAKRSNMPTIAVIVVAAVLVLAGVGWFVGQRFRSGPAPDPAATQQVFTQASSLAKRGQYDRAIALLQDVKPEDPQHDRALQMIADLQQKKTQASQMVGGRPAADVYQEALTNAQTALGAHDYETAKKAFDAAARIKPLPPDMQALYDQASQQSAKLDGAKALFNERKYQDAINALQQLQQSDPQNMSIKRMITDAHFNLGAQALQNEKIDDAMREFDEVLKNDPNDELARRSKTLAERYNGQPKDLLYQIYVKYLPMRSVG